MLKTILQRLDDGRKKAGDTTESLVSKTDDTFVKSQAYGRDKSQLSALDTLRRCRSSLQWLFLLVCGH